MKSGFVRRNFITVNQTAYAFEGSNPSLSIFLGSAPKAHPPLAENPPLYISLLDQ